MKPILPPALGAPRRSRYVLVLLLATSAMPGADRIAEKMRGVDRGQTTAPAPTLLFGINDATGGLAEPGWPLIVTAVRMADDKAPVVPLPSDLRLKVTSERGAETAVDFTAVPRADAESRAGTLHWLASETATRALAAGRYRVTASAGSTWRVESGVFQIVAPNPERSGLPGLLRIRRSVLLGNTEEALAEANRLTTVRAEDQAAWIAKGDILIMQDKPDEALAAFDRALALQKKSERGPLALLTRRRNAFVRSHEKRGVISPQR